MPRIPSLLPAALLLATACAGAADAPRCTYGEIAAMPVRYVGPSLMPAVDGSIDGTPATMLIDTGSYETLLTMTGVVKRDLPLHMTGRYVKGIGGSSRLYSTRLKEFAVGPARTTRRLDLGIVYDTTFTPAFDAIVGAPFLLQRDLEFDLRARQIRFFRPQDCDDTPLYLWQEETIAVPFERSFDRSPNPHFTVVVNGRELDAVIDTGAHDSFMVRSAAKRAGIDVAAPGVKRLGDASGVGAERAPQWAATVKSIRIGDETINDAEIGIVDAPGSLSADLYLGQDFLRSHRVLFAMSQQKLYLAYLGGDVFARGTGIEPWMRAEAEAGNGDAQFRLANAYGNGNGVARDLEAAREWMDKAVAAGQPHANLRRGRQLLLAGQPAAAIPLLRRALDQLPAERLGPLWLYTARVRNGEPDLARQELAASVARQQEDDWPEPLARFYLGKLDAAGLLDEAGKDRKLAARRQCQAENYMAEWHAAQGDKARADGLMAGVRTHCGKAAPVPDGATTAATP